MLLVNYFLKSNQQTPEIQERTKFHNILSKKKKKTNKVSQHNKKLKQKQKHPNLDKILNKNCITQAYTK